MSASSTRPGAPLPRGDAGMVLAALRRQDAPARPLRVVVDSRPFLVGERKLGLGRSAATLVAAVAALGADDPAAIVLRRALDANALFQDGQGSGADVAAAVHGGVIEVRRTAAELAAHAQGAAGRAAPDRGLDRHVGAHAAAPRPLRRRPAAAGVRRPHGAPPSTRPPRSSAATRARCSLRSSARRLSSSASAPRSTCRW